MPDGSLLTASEVRQLRLKNAPFVLLLSCEGASGDRSIATESMAESLKAAGAVGVWGFEQKVDARDAVDLAERFLRETSRGVSAIAAIKTVTAQRAKSSPSTRLKLDD
jgi:CHAT domain